MREAAIHNLQHPPGSAAEPRSHKGFWSQRPAMLPDLQCRSPPALPPHCIHSIQNYLFICLCSSRDHSFIHFSILSLLSQNGREGCWAGSDQDRDLLNCRGLAGHPTACMRTRIHHNAPETGMPCPCTAPLRCLSSVPPRKASAPRMPQAPLGQQRTHGWGKHRQSTGSAHG